MPTVTLVQRVFLHGIEAETGVLSNPGGVPGVWPLTPLCPVWGQAHAVRILGSGMPLRPFTWKLWLPGNGHVFAQGVLVPDALGNACDVRSFLPCLLGCTVEPYAYLDVVGEDLETREQYIYAPTGPSGLLCHIPPPC